MSIQKNNLSALVSAALVASAFGVSGAQAADNPFSAVSLGEAVQIAGMEGKCGEGKCGSGSEDSTEDGAEGEGKCGEKPDSEDMGEDKQGEGMCGEGKCGNM